MEFGYPLASYWMPDSRLNRTRPSGHTELSGVTTTTTVCVCEGNLDSSHKCPPPDQSIVHSPTQPLLGDPEEDDNRPPMIWFWPSILAFLVCCPLGYAAVISVYQAQTAWEKGDRAETKKLRGNTQVFVALSFTMALTMWTIILLKTDLIV